MTTRTQGRALVRLLPALKDYAWGDARYIPELLGQPVGETPVAEAWFGTHPQGPSRVEAPAVPLPELLREEAGRWLGPDLAREGVELPFLVKFLAAARPLSIQVHPDTAQAREGFAREDAAGIPRDAPERCYRDPHAKPEIILALEPFEALCGFRPDDEIRAALSRQPELADLAWLCGRGWNGQKELLRHWFELPEDDVRRRQAALVERLRTQELLTGAERLLLEIVRDVPGDVAADRGLLFALLLEHVHLDPGQALFLRAGVPHAYLRGAGLEVMGASDNVLRAGLTGKHVAPQELQRIVRFAAGGAWRVAPEDVSGDERVYRTAAREFEVSCLACGEAPVVRAAAGPELLVVLTAEESVEVRAGEEALRLPRGGACLLAHGTRVALRGAGTVARVRVP